MIRTKDGVRPRVSRIVTYLALGLSVMELGCTRITGLRSVGTDRPTLLGFWDRSRPPTPNPGDDYYAQSMHAARDRADAMAKRSAETPARTGHGGDPERGSQGDEVVGSTSRAGSSKRPAPPARPVRNETIRVTLGRPERLPTLPASAASATKLTSTGSSSQWKGAPWPSDPASSPAPRLAHEPEDLREPGQTSPQPGAGQPARRLSPDLPTILAQSEAKLRSLETYQVMISRVERVGGRLQPEESILLSIRRDPKAVRLEWPAGPNQGREVIYSSRLDQRSLFVHQPSSPIPLPTMKIPIDSPLVTKNSRHSISEAGFETIIDNLRKSLERKGPQKSDLTDLVYQGVEQPTDLDRLGYRFTHRSPAGETWTVFLDARTMLPCLVVANDSSGELIERYVYHEVRENPTELAAADAFDPDQRWGGTKGFLSRFAGTAAGTDVPKNRQSATR